MTFVKPRRWPYFDFREQLRLFPTLAQLRDATRALALHQASKAQRDAALQRHFAMLNAKFKDSLDAVTACRLSPGGLAHLKLSIRQGQRQRCFYRLEDRQARTGWWHYETIGMERGRPVGFIGQYMLYGKLHAELACIDSAVNGPHPVGTIIETAAAFDMVQPGHMQHQPYLIHTDGSPLSSRTRWHSVLDVMDDSGLETEYVQGYRPDRNDPLLPLLRKVAGLVQNQKCSVRHYEWLRGEPEYQKELVALAPRLWKALPRSVVQRSAQTPHTGSFVPEQPEPAKPVLRAHVHDLYARP